MKQCTTCDILIDLPAKHCPLCYTTLVSYDQKPEFLSYPNLSQQSENYNLLMRILIFLSITVATISAIVNFLIPTKFPWSLIVIFCILYVWVALGTAIRRRHKIGFNLMMQLLSLGALLTALSYLIGFRHYLFDYLIPALLAATMISFNVLAIARRREIESFILYFLIVSALGFLPVLFYALDLAQILWPSICCAAYSGLSIVSIFLFADQLTKGELKKRFKL